MTTRRIYVASSWKNGRQPLIVETLRLAGHEVYDFRNPAPGNTGFSWSSIDPNWESWTSEEFVKALDHPAALDGFRHDKDAMNWADTCVLVLPCGKSAHLEAGYMAAQGKRVLVLLMDDSQPELMYRLVLPDGGMHSLVGEVVSALEGAPDEGPVEMSAFSKNFSEFVSLLLAQGGLGLNDEFKEGERELMEEQLKEGAGRLSLEEAIVGRYLSADLALLVDPENAGRKFVDTRKLIWGTLGYPAVAGAFSHPDEPKEAEAPPATSVFSSTFRKFSELLLGLHSLALSGEDQRPQADAIRLEMEPLWDLLGEEETQVARCLSADLWRVSDYEGQSEPLPSDLPGLDKELPEIYRLREEAAKRVCPLASALALETYWVEHGCPKVAAVFASWARRLESERVGTADVPKAEEWYTSATAERFSGGPYDSKEEAITSYVEECGLAAHDIPPGQAFFVGRKEEITSFSTVSGEQAIEQAALDMHDLVGEVAEEWPDATQEQVKELDGLLDDVFSKWIHRHGLTPGFFAVTDVQSIELKEVSKMIELKDAFLNQPETPPGETK